MLALGVLGLAACSSMDTMQAAKAPPPDPATQMGALETDIFSLVAADRKQLDPSAKTVMLDPELSAVARSHSLAMARQHFLGHKAPDGETTATLMMDRDKDFQGLLGENLAAQYFTPSEGVDPKEYAERFVASWMGSKSHRDNLGFADYSRAGVGAAVEGNTVYVTLLFSAPIMPAAGSGKPRGVETFIDAKTAQAAPEAAPGPAPAFRLRGSEANALAGPAHE